MKTHLPLQEMVAVLADTARAEKIILFGSHATGTAGPDSDVDLLVVWNGGNGLRHIERRVELRRMLRDFVSVPMDILTYSTQELEEILLEPDCFTAQIVREGKVLYEKVA